MDNGNPSRFLAFYLSTSIDNRDQGGRQYKIGNSYLQN